VEVVDAIEAVQLAGYRREVAAAYAAARAGGPGEATWAAWRARRDRLIATHPQSPLPPALRGGSHAASGHPAWRTPFHPYDPAWRVAGRVRPAGAGVRGAVPHSSTGATPVEVVGTVAFTLLGADQVLPLLWVDAYGGGLFLPFRDATCGTTTYGGGRYLLDTVKGADLGETASGELVLDFNYAYHPSCAWDGRWSCPLAQPDSALDIAVAAGELLPLGTANGARER
jgi:uncharacterized protein (DUF1684 family)